MIITCNGCDTNFSLDERVLSNQVTKVRCSSCHQVFTASPPATVPDQSDGPLPETDKVKQYVENLEPDEILDIAKMFEMEEMSWGSIFESQMKEGRGLSSGEENLEIEETLDADERDPKKKRIAFFDFADCEGCQLQVTYLDDQLLDVLEFFEIVNFREAISERSDDYDIAVVEGSITRQHDEDRVIGIRERANTLIIEDISSFGVDNISFMMHLSFIIGAIHLTLAHGIRSLRLINSTKAFSELGWILLVWGLFFVAEKLVLGKAIPQWNNWLFMIGVLLVTLFNGEGRNLMSSMLVSIANLPLSLINGFSDIVSYVRLFAVGMATATVASSFNNMILPAGVDLSFLELLMAVVALFLGHALNIVLALMAVMVHGIRLNMLEFAGHLGIQFSGEAYKPFKLRALSKQVEKV